MTHRPAWLDRTLADCPHIDPGIPEDEDDDAPWLPPVWLSAALIVCLTAAGVALALALR